MVSCGACTTESAFVPTDSGGIDGPLDSVVDADDGGAQDAFRCDPVPEFLPIPKGYLRDDTYSRCCGFYSPMGSNYLPASIAWEACDALAASTMPNGTVCKTIANVWMPDAGASSSLGASGVYDPATGKVDLNLTFKTGNRQRYALVAEVDGPIKQAMYQLDTDRCAAAPFPVKSIGAGYFVWSVDDLFSSGGFIAGTNDVFGSRVPHHWADTLAHMPMVGALGVVDLVPSGLTVWPLPGLSPPQSFGTPQADPDKLPLGLQAPSRYGVLWQASNGLSAKIRSWTPDGGAGDFVSYLDGGDFQHGAGDVADDGTDMFWSEGTGIQKVGPFATGALFTAPSTTDPIKLQATKRRLRSLTDTIIGISPATVGCGYAAREGAGATGVELVRLSDGVGWLLADKLTNPAWTWQAPLAISCSELFVSVFDRDHTTVARVRLDSLGAGLPPD